MVTQSLMISDLKFQHWHQPMAHCGGLKDPWIYQRAEQQETSGMHLKGPGKLIEYTHT